MNGYSRYLPAGIAAGFAMVYFLAMAIPATNAPNKMQLAEAARIPVVQGGRIVPLDTVARNNLMIISGRQSFTDDAGNSVPAIKWLLEVMTLQMPGGKDTTDAAYDYKIFRIENFQVLSLLHLEPRSGFRYSYAELAKNFSEFDKQFKRALNRPDADKELFEIKIVELAHHVRLFQQLADFEVPLVIPPTSSGEEWRSLRDAGPRDKRPDSAVVGLVSILDAYKKMNVKAFNAALKDYEELLDKQLPHYSGRVDFEVFFNHLAPFFHCAVLYVFVLILACASWIAFPRELSQAAIALAVVTLLVHTFALLGRMYLMGRAFVFVTNLYSSAVFIGWVCVILGLVLERIYHNGVGSFVAAVTGSLSLIIAHYLATSGDTIEMMQAVLDTNFWLATHVTSVTIGYSATFVAGFLGATMIGLGVFTTKMNKELFRVLGQMIYGIVCFALLFSFIGTVLGGIWADYSWGRFWGWDAKENGALLIVLWNALLLHARWGGMVQQRGMAVLAVGGNIVTAWSWFGVNMLEVGLHSYGFKSGTQYWLLAFVASQLVIMGIGLVPLRMWPGFSAAAPTPVPLQTPPALDLAPPNAIKSRAELGRGDKKSNQIKAR